MNIRLTRARRIYADGRHNAFTGITEAHGSTLVAFRSATNHLEADGIIKVIASADREAWDVVAEATLPDTDLRDPKLVTFGQKTMLFCGARGADRSLQSMAMTSTDGNAFGELVSLQGIRPGHWLWHVQPCGDKLLGAAYGRKDQAYAAALYASGDGITWEHLTDFPVLANEVFLDVDDKGVLRALARNDRDGGIPALCTAEPPYTQFQSIQPLPMRLQGPMLKRLGDGCVIICRQWDKPGRRRLRTDIFWLQDGHDIRYVDTLPSGGDTSYAGWLDTGQGRAVVSYYSSHEHKMDEPHDRDGTSQDPAAAEHSTGADIFLADISYA